MDFLRIFFGKRLVVFFSCFLLVIISLPLPAFGQPASEPSLSNRQLAQIQWLDNTVNSMSVQQPTLAFIFRYFRRQRRSDLGSPSNSGSAGRRGPCNSLNQSFAALVPRANENQTEIVTTKGIELTTRIQPSIFVHLPDLSSLPPEPDSLRYAQLMIQQLQTNTREVDWLDTPLEIPIPLSFNGGIAEINFEKLNLTLEPNQAYHWYLSLICNPERPSGNPSIDAWIEVLDANEQKNITTQAANILEQSKKVEFYIQQEIWPEAVKLLLQLRCQDPNNMFYKTELTELLTNPFVDNEIEMELKNKIAEAVETQQCFTQL